MDPFDKMMWAYRAIFKQTDVGGGTIVVNDISFERTVILYGLLGPNDYAANRTVVVYISDGTDRIGRLLEGIALDNARMPFPSTGEGAAVTADSSNEFDKTVVLGRGDRLFIQATSLVQNEELTVAMRALITKDGPSVTTTGSAGTVTTTTTYNKVI